MRRDRSLPGSQSNSLGISCVFSSSSKLVHATVSWRVPRKCASLTVPMSPASIHSRKVRMES